MSQVPILPRSLTATGEGLRERSSTFISVRISAAMQVTDVGVIGELLSRLLNTERRWRDSGISVTRLNVVRPRCVMGFGPCCAVLGVVSFERMFSGCR